MPCKFSCCKELNDRLNESMNIESLFKAREDLVPTTIMIIQMIQKTPSGRLLRVLFDSGGTKIMINASALPKGCNPRLLEKPLKTNTIQGTMETLRFVTLETLMLPEFDRSLKVEQHRAYVFNGPCKYDLILGRYFFGPAGITLDFLSHTMKWCSRTVSMKNPSSSNAQMYGDSFEHFDWDEIDSFASQILQADYKSADTDEVAREQTHLTKDQQKNPAELLGQFKKLFSGKLGKYEGKKVHLEVEKDSRPKHAKPYSVPHTQMNLYKEELMRLVDIGVLRPIGATEWASPTFIRPKKDNTVRWLSDFRELNKVLKRRVYPLPNIQEVLMKRSGYEFFSKLDISMCYYTFELDEESQELCTIVTPVGKFCYNCLAMGRICSPHICQELMENIFRDIEDSDVFIDDIGAFSKSWKSHVQLLHKIFTRLQDNGFTVNPRKCEWGVKETDYLGYWLTPTGLKPWKKKVDAILKMDRPRNIKQLRSFLGAVNFYRDMWPRRSHVLKPLTELTGKGQFVWDPDPDNPMHTKALLPWDKSYFNRTSSSIHR